MPTSSSPPCSFSRRGLVLVQAQLQARQALADRGRDARQQIRADGRQQRHPQLAGERIALAARERDDLVARLEDAPRARPDLFPGRGERDVVGRPLDELHPESLLELFQLRRQRRLADEAARGRTAEVTVVGHRHQVAQVLEFQLHGPAEIYSIYRKDKINRCGGGLARLAGLTGEVEGQGDWTLCTLLG